MTVDVQHISAEARAANLGRTILTALAAVLYAVGWVLAKVLGGVWFVLAWSFAAMRLGWHEARKPGPPPPTGWVEVE